MKCLPVFLLERRAEKDRSREVYLAASKGVPLGSKNSKMNFHDAQTCMLKTC